MLDNYTIIPSRILGLGHGSDLKKWFDRIKETYGSVKAKEIALKISECFME